MKEYKLYFGNGGLCPNCQTYNLVDGGCLVCEYYEEI